MEEEVFLVIMKFARSKVFSLLTTIKILILSKRDKKNHMNFIGQSCDEILSLYLYWFKIVTFCMVNLLQINLVYALFPFLIIVGSKKNFKETNQFFYASTHNPTLFFFMPHI